MTKTDLIHRLTADWPITAGAFIVTVYGDVVVPRGEVLWIGSLIGLCARIGIRENLVRTAVSRLVSADRLQGERVGRRSFYRLAPSARAEFADAARLLYGKPRPSGEWLVMLHADMPEAMARRHRMARLGADLWICPAREDIPASGGLILRAAPVAGLDRMPDLARLWDLDSLAAGYAQVLDRFGTLCRALDREPALTPEDALIVRLLLVHLYRGVLLRDPGLPPEALPRDWPGTRAQALFRCLYAALTPWAEAHVGRALKGDSGPLPETTARTQARMRAMA